jgi:uncharacterized protein YecE (DUF72 family)
MTHMTIHHSPLTTKPYHIGTSGWSYKHWKELFYPANLKSAEWFSYYAERFDVSEINMSFYNLPKIKTVENWAAKAPKGFKFCPKLSRFITHMKKLHDPEEPLERFFTVFEPLQKLMGPVLVQLPPMVAFHYDIAENFFEALKAYKKNEFVLEIRHVSWLSDDSLTLMAKHNIGLVISQSGKVFPYSEMVTAKNIYVRFHGPKELYASEYTTRMLRSYAKKFAGWIEEGHKIWAFFNNDIHGYAFADAQKLVRMMEEELS